MNSLHASIDDIDSLVIATGLALASLTPGPAGIAGAAAAIAYDMKRKQWIGAALSAASMVPLLGYLPAVFKVGWLVFQLHRSLNILEASGIDIRASPESVALVNGLGKYYRNLPDFCLTRPLRGRLERIMGLGQPNQSVPPVASDNGAEGTSSSTQIPK